MKSKPVAFIFLTMVVLAAIVMVSAGTLFMLTYQEAILDFEKAMGEMTSNTILLDRYNRPFKTLRGIESRLKISQSNINRNLQISILAAEDTRFFQHRGVDVQRLLSALFTNLVSGSYREGASTITQQLVKLTLLSPEKTLFRKFREMVIAISLEMKFSKEKILLHYLNTVYLAHGNFGVEQASRAYFNKTASEISLAEAAFLAALLKKPEAYLKIPDSLSKNTTHFPQKSIQAALKRQQNILLRLFDLGWITKSVLVETQTEVLQVNLPKTGAGSGSYFIQHVTQLLKREHGLETIFGGGYRVKTTFDPLIQSKLEAVVLSYFSAKKNAPQAALVSLMPKNGHVIALIGGRDFLQSQFNRATQAKRQPGSAFKPFVYATALENGYSPNSVLSDHPLYYEWENEEDELQMYAPSNYDSKFGKERSFKNQFGEVYQTEQMTLAKALEQSINTIAVQLLDQVGIETFKKFLLKAKIDLGNNSGLCLALGCAEVNLLQLTAAYTPFLNEGKFMPPVFILRIEDKWGNLIYQRTETEDIENIKNQNMMSAWNAHQMEQMLRGVVQKGSGRGAKWPGSPEFMGGKTGTSSNSRDAWFIGYLQQVITGVWLGYDDYKAMPGEQGGRTPARIWKLANRSIYSDLPEVEPQKELPLVRLKTCTISGKLATSYCPEAVFYDYQLQQPEPEYCDLHTDELGSSVKKSDFTRKLELNFRFQ